MQGRANRVAPVMEGLAPADGVRPLDRIPDPTADEALRQLHHAHGSVLLGFLVRLTHGDRHRAEDILQETLLRAWRHPQARGADGEWSRAG
jgi:RNA polymerase sigma-70 factor, ECF subfamily